MIKIIIADDHPIVRAGMKQIISEASDLKVADEASDCHKLLSKTREGNFDVVILDITMPHMDGLELLKAIRSRNKDVPVLMVNEPVPPWATRISPPTLTVGLSLPPAVPITRKTRQPAEATIAASCASGGIPSPNHTTPGRSSAVHSGQRGRMGMGTRRSSVS